MSEQRRRADRPDPTLLCFLEIEDHRDLLLPWLDAISLSQLQVNKATREWTQERLDENRVTPADVLAGVQLQLLRRLVDEEFALVDGTIQLGQALFLKTEELRLLGEEGMVITRADDPRDGITVCTWAEDVVIEKVAVRRFAVINNVP